MGLDTYAGRVPVDFFDPDLDETQVDDDFGCTREDLEAFERAEAQRERDSGHCLFGSNYFRGKLYVELIRYVTGESLYQTWIPPETVRGMADALERCDVEQVVAECSPPGPLRRLDPSVVEDLRAFFRVCAERGLGLVGSW